MLSLILSLSLFLSFVCKNKVWIRSARWIRGWCVGYVAAFDKQWNLAMTDVDETFTRKRRRKTPVYGIPSSPTFFFSFLFLFLNSFFIKRQIAKKFKQQQKKKRSRLPFSALSYDRRPPRSRTIEPDLSFKVNPSPLLLLLLPHSTSHPLDSRKGRAFSLTARRAQMG